MKPIYIAAYHQSKFGKLMGMTVPEIVGAAIEGACRQIDVPASALDVGIDRRRLQFFAQSPGTARRPDGYDSGSGRQAHRGRRKCLRLRRPGGALGDPEAAARHGRNRHRCGLRKDARRRRQDGRQAHRRSAGLFLLPRRARRQGLRLPPPLRRSDAGLHGRPRRLRSRPGGHRRAGICQRQIQLLRADEQGADHPRPGAEDRRHQSLRGGWPAAQDLRLLADHRWLCLPDPGHRRGPGEARLAQGRVRRDRRLGAGHRPHPQDRPRRAASRRRLPRDEQRLPDGRGAPRGRQRG